MGSPRELFREQLPLIERVIDRVCRRGRVFGADADDFASTVKLALIEDDYAILRGFEERSSLATYLAVVIQRMLADEQMRTIGRWHPSAEARALGEAAVMIETLVTRDGRSLDAAFPLVRDAHPSLTRQEAEAIVARLPVRVRRPRAVELDEHVAETFVAPERADARVLEREARDRTQTTGAVMRAVLERFGLEDRMLIRLRFVSSMTIADIARMMDLPQRPLYRRLEALLAEFRKQLTAAGIDAAFIAEFDDLDLGLREPEMHDARQTMNSEESR